MITRAEAGVEARDAKETHLDLLIEIEKRSLTENQQRDKYLYLMAVPIVYAVWEGYFKMSIAVCFKRLYEVNCRPRPIGRAFPTLWLQKESFVASFLQNLVNAMSPGTDVSKKINVGKFKALAGFSNDIAKWLASPVPAPTDFVNLVMTHSNVNESVAKANADIIGLDLAGVDFGRINQLLNLRNDVSHGGLLQLPEAPEIERTINYTKELINQFDSAVQRWIKQN